jgi:2-polyprenyl-3-methyl-5-hydroxy-6-metoxy-1,4-benzoquinol methylase
MPRHRPSPFDWESFWLHEGEDDGMRMGAERMAHRISRLVASTGATTVADVGCGSGRTILTLARAHPDLELVGYDASPLALLGCKERARDLGLKNVRFARGSLPSLAAKDGFDLVLCIVTLHYVRDVRTAVRSLWAMVGPGGTLVFNYPNRFTMHAYRRWVAEVGDPSLNERFALVLAGENLLTLREVRELLGARPRSLWGLMARHPRPPTCVSSRAVPWSPPSAYRACPPGNLDNLRRPWSARCRDDGRAR